METIDVILFCFQFVLQFMVYFDRASSCAQAVGTLEILRIGIGHYHKMVAMGAEANQRILRGSNPSILL